MQYQQNPQYNQPQRVVVERQGCRPPCGVMVMSLLLFLQGAFRIITGIFGILGLVVLIFDPSRGGSLLLHGGVSIVLGVFSLILALCLLLLMKWAYYATVLISLFNLVSSLYILAISGFAAWTQIFSALFALAVLIYFLGDRDPRRAFRVGF